MDETRLIGKQFGKLTVIAYNGKDAGCRSIWKCICECGKERNVRNDTFRHYRSRGLGLSCGCHVTGKSSRHYKGYELVSGEYVNSLRQGAKDRNMVFEVTAKQIWELYIKQDRKCYLTGLEIYFKDSKIDKSKQTASVDRIDSSKGYVLDNIQLVHKDLNMMKQNFSQEQFLKYCRLVVSNADII